MDSTNVCISLNETSLKDSAGRQFVENNVLLKLSYKRRPYRSVIPWNLQGTTDVFSKQIKYYKHEIIPG